MIPDRLPSLPPLDPAAYHGIAGEIACTIAPHTEADPVALLVSTLAVAGAMMGDGPHVMIGALKHPARIWPLIIGRTSSGRKGESWSQTENVVIEADPVFAADRMTRGLSTGEGIIACFAEGDKDEHGNLITLPDKRLLVVESEFARPLTASRREGNTLSQALRGLWDNGTAGILTRAAPVSCKGAHLVIVGHVTPRELTAKVSDTDIGGGLLNRFLPILSQRPHLMPNPGFVDVMGLGAELGTRTVRARAAGRQLRRDDEAEALWAEAYTAMAHDEADGPLGEILARGPAYAMRLALTYALLDSDRAIREVHLRAALAVWHYAAASAQRVFTFRQSDTDRLADFIAEQPRTKTDLRDFFGRNKTGAEIDEMLYELGEQIAVDTDRSGPGRPVIRVRWIGPPRTSLTAVLGHEATTERFNDISRSEGTDFGRKPGRTTKVPPVKAQVSGDMSFSRKNRPLKRGATIGQCNQCLRTDRELRGGYCTDRVSCMLIQAPLPGL